MNKSPAAVFRIKPIPVIAMMAIGLSINACGQTAKENNPTSQKDNTMDLSLITNTTIRKAVEALQANDKKAWYSCFTDNAVFTDDGNTVNLKSFFDNAFEKKEKFLSIDKVENDGRDLYGNFYAGQWGTFKVFFRFHIGEDGRIRRLDIGQDR